MKTARLPALYLVSFLALFLARGAAGWENPYVPRMSTDPFAPVDGVPTRLLFETWCLVWSAPAPTVVRVGDTFKVDATTAGCLLFYPPAKDPEFSVDLGILPAGSYTVELIDPQWSWPLEVKASPRLAVSPALPPAGAPLELRLDGVVGPCPSAGPVRAWADQIEVALSLGDCPGPAQSVDLRVPLGPLAAGKYEIQVAGDLVLPPLPLEVLPERARLGGGRFEVAARWRNAAGETGEARLAQTPSADSALYYFFDDSNWELMVKVLDGCALNSHFWVFAAAATDVELTGTVVDLEQNRSFRFGNELGHPAAALTSIDAFPCP